MKKLIAILLSVLCVTILLSSCGSMKSTDMMTDSAPSSSTNNWGDGKSKNTAPQAPQSEMDLSYTIGRQADGQSDESGISPVTATIVDSSFAEKIIYTVEADIETVSFDETIDGIYKLLTSNRGFIEASNIGGRNYEQSYYGWQTYRTAQFTLRIPKELLNTVTASLDTLGNVTSLRSVAENITAQFFDSESRLNSYKTQEDRLLDMLSKTNNVTDMISIEERLADIRYQIEALTSTLRNWQNQVDYSTVNLYVHEVEVFTKVEPLQQRTYWQEIGEGFKASAGGVGDFFKDLFKGLIISLPVLILLAVFAIVIIIVIRRFLKRSAKQAEQNPGFSHYR